MVPYRLDTDRELASTWATTRTTLRGRVDTLGGEADYIAVPLRVAGETRGVFVDAIFWDVETREVEPPAGEPPTMPPGLPLVGGGERRLPHGAPPRGDRLP